MSTNQLHGKEFELAVLAALGIPSVSTKPTDIFDIPLVTTTKCAGSLKLSQCSPEVGKSIVHLSDACRVWSWEASLRCRQRNLPALSTQVSVLSRDCMTRWRPL